MVLSKGEWGVTDLDQVGVSTERQALGETMVGLFAHSANLNIHRGSVIHRLPFS